MGLSFDKVVACPLLIDCSVGFFDYLPSGVLIQGNVNSHCCVHVLQANGQQNAFFELSGYPKDPALNKQLTFLDCIYDEDVEMIMEKWSGLVSGKAVTFEMRWKNGSPNGQWVQAACAPVFDNTGNFVSISGCTTDISAQKLAQENALKKAEALEQVRVSQARLLQFTDNAPIGIVIQGPSGDALYINHSWFNITGHSQEPSSGVDVPSICYGNDISTFVTKQNEAVEQRKAVEFRARLKKEWTNVDGSFQGQAWVSIICFPEFGDDGELSRIMSTWTDISHSQFSEHIQRKRLEEALEARKRTEAFIDITSHEIRNPLGATVHCADLLKESLVEAKELIDELLQGDSDDTSRQNIGAQLAEHFTSGTEAVDTILSCSMHQKRVTDDILSLSKLDSNLLDVSPSTVRAADILNNVSNIFSVEAARSGVVLQTQLDSSLSDHGIEWVVVDPGRITQVLVNLITNAIKFTKTSEDERTVTVRLGASRKRPCNLSVVYAKTDGLETRNQTDLPTGDAAFYLWFSVTDSGCGMSEEEQTRMFDRFSQASPKTYNQYGGSGLGLFISKRLVELQGGQIGLASEVDTGSRFAFYVLAAKGQKPEDLPRLRPAKRASLHDIRPTTTTTTTTTTTAIRSALVVDHLPSDCTVLIVEDNLVNQKILQKHLIKLGYKVQTANHGQEALDYLATTNAWKQQKQQTKTKPRIESSLQDVHVILMDIEMPVMDGLTCSRRIRDMQGSGDIVRHVPIIAVSANARAEQTKQAYDAGVDDFIAKPFRIPDLTSVIVRVLEAA